MGSRETTAGAGGVTNGRLEVKDVEVLFQNFHQTPEFSEFSGFLNEISDFGRIPVGPVAKFVNKVWLVLVRGLAADVLESIREKEKQMEAVHSEEVQPDGLT
jgi:hypothetical protein